MQGSSTGSTDTGSLRQSFPTHTGKEALRFVLPHQTAHFAHFATLALCRQMAMGEGCGRGRRRRRRCLPNGTVACIINMRRVFGKVSAGCVLNSVDPMSHCATPTLKYICNFKATATIAQHFAIFAAHFISHRYRNVPEPVTSFYLSAKTIPKLLGEHFACRCNEMLPRPLSLPLLLFPISVSHLHYISCCCRFHEEFYHM